MKINNLFILIILIIPLVLISGCTGAFSLNNPAVITPMPNVTISSIVTSTPGDINQNAPLATQIPLGNISVQSNQSSNETQNRHGSNAIPTPSPTLKPTASPTVSPAPSPSATARPTSSPVPSVSTVPHAAGSVTGRVTTNNDVGISGAYVAIVDSNDLSHIYYETTADSGGYFQFANVASTGEQALYKMYARQSSYGEGYSTSFSVSESATSCVSVVIFTNSPTPSANPSGSITGRVTTQNMAGIAGAYMAIVDAADHSIKYYEGTSDSNGYYSFTGVEPTNGQRSYQVYAKQDSYGEGYSGAFSVEAKSTSTTSVVIFIKPSSISVSSSGNVQANSSGYATISAYVTDSHGGIVADGYPIVFSLSNTSGSAGSLAPVSSNTPAGNSVTANTQNGYASVQFGWATIAGTNTVHVEYQDNPAVASSIDVHITS